MFNNFCFTLNRLHLSWLAASLRWTLAHLFGRYIEVGEYDNPEGVGGYRAWYDLPGLGCVAFIRSDGTRQYRW